MNIDISPNLEKDFKNFVLEKHGKLRGKLGEEMEKALSFYLTHQEKTDTQDATTNAPLEKQLESDMQVISSANQTNNDIPVSYTHLRAHETKANLVCRLL